jgi:hypothetical protein
MCVLKLTILYLSKYETLIRNIFFLSFRNLTFASMIKRSSIFLVAAVIFFESLLPNGLGISQVSRIGELYHHYLEHKQEGTSLGTFLWMHYSSDSGHKTNKEHKNLPSFESQISFLAFVPLVSLNMDSNFKENVIFNEVFNSLEYSNLYRFQYLKSLLNPPQFG